LNEILVQFEGWTKKAATQAEVRVFILDKLYASLPRPPFTETETEDIASRVYDYVWQKSASGQALVAA
jgi:type I restriction enzyme R subunit